MSGAGPPERPEGPEGGENSQKSNGSDEPAYKIPYAPFEGPLKGKTVGLLELVRANVLRSPTLTPEPDRQAVGRRYFPEVSAAFLEAHPEAQVAVQGDAGLGACLLGGRGSELELLAIRSTIRFDWSEPRVVEGDLILLEDEAKRWLGDTDLRSLQLMLFTIAVQVQTCTANENVRHPHGQEMAAPTPQLAKELAGVGPRIAGAQARLQDEAPRAAQVVYAAGMGFGAGVLGILCGAIAAIFALEGISATNAVALLAGGIGACLSVLQRMTFGRKLALDYKVGRRMLIVFGAVRPFVGGAFGMITFCALRAGLLSGTLVIPHDEGAQLAFYAFFGFAAGFNERFFQDMLRTASPAFGGDSPSETVAAER